MPKKETQKIQEFLAKLGEKLGFISKMEYKQKNTTNYNPIYDVVWFIKKETYNFSSFDVILSKTQKWKSLTNLIPVATFEIEGSTTTSKNQMGNLLNLSLINSFLSFIIVNNKEASNENDTYRRGVRICRTFMEFSNNQNIIFLDWEYIKEIDKLIDFNLEERPNNEQLHQIKRSKVGGENDSILMKNIIELLKTTKLKIRQNYTPQIFKWHYSKIQQLQNINTSNDYDYQLYRKYIYDPVKNTEKTIKKISDIYYLPKIDFSLELIVPQKFKMFLLEIGKKLQEQIYYYPILNYFAFNPKEDLLFPILGIEVESSVNKHLNGGIFNMAHFFHAGILISKESGLNHVNTLSELGINNIFHINEKIIKEISQ